MQPKTVSIFESQFLRRRGLIALIDSWPGLEMSFETSSFELLKDRLCVKPTDLSIICEDDIATVQGLMDDKNVPNSLRIISIIEENSREVVRNLMDLGVRSILTIRCDEEEIQTALQAVSNGKRFFCDRVLAIMLDRGMGKVKSMGEERLSKRELEVLELIVQGNITASIADKLFVSVHTINTHRKNILKKLNLKSPTQLILYAVEKGLIKLNPDKKGYNSG